MAPSTATRPRTSRGQATRRRIVETAANLIFDQGISSTTLDSLDSWENLHGWPDMFVRLHAERPCSGGCPIGSLAAEIVDKDEQARLDLVHAFDRWQSYLRRGFHTLQARRAAGGRGRRGHHHRHHGRDRGRLAALPDQAGGVGLMLTQLIKARGGMVIGLVSRAEKVDLAREAGADHGKLLLVP
jgi:hypothetical protein